MKTSGTWVAVAIVLALVAPSSTTAQEKTGVLSPQEVIRRYEKAVGKDGYLKLQSRHTKGSVEVPALNGRGDFEFWEKAPDKSVMHVRLSGITEHREGYDGKTAWSQDEDGLRVLEGAEREEAIRSSEFLEDVRVMENFPTLKYLGLRDVEGRKAHAVEGKSPIRGTEMFFFDAITWLLIRRDMKIQGGIASMILADYRQIDGIQFPFELRETSTGLIMRVQQIRHNIAFDDQVFAKPSAPKKN